MVDDDHDESSRLLPYDLYEHRQTQGIHPDLPEEPIIHEPTAPNSNDQNAPTDGLRKHYHRNASEFDEDAGANLLQKMQQDELHDARVESGNVFFPFHSQKEWQLVDWFGKSSLSQAHIGSFLKLDMVNTLSFVSNATNTNNIQYKESGLTLTSAQDIRNRVEKLPEVPKWQHQTISFPPYTTRDPIVLYWRDGLEVIASLFSNPVFANAMEYTPYQLLEEGTGARAYGEFMSANYAWDYVVRDRSYQL